MREKCRFRTEIRQLSWPRRVRSRPKSHSSHLGQMSIEPDMGIDKIRNETLSKEISRLSSFVLLGGIAYPLWALVYRFAAPASYDPLYLRGLTTAVLVGCFLYLKRDVKSLSRVHMAFGISSYIMTIHFFYILYMNNASFLHASGSVIVIATVIAALPSRTSVVIYSVLTTLLSIGISLMADVPIENGVFLVAGAITATLAGSVVQFSRFETIDELAEKNTESHLILDNLVEGVVLQSRDGSIYSSNVAAEGILGLNQNDLIGSNSIDSRWNAIHEDGTDWDGSTHPAMMALKTGQPQLHKIMGLKRTTGKVTWISINAQPIYREGEVLPSSVVASFHDVTAKRESENLLQEQQLRLVGSAKMSALGEMAAGVAHEINNPLAIISGRSAQVRRALEKQPQDIPRALTLMQNIDDTVQRISKIVQGLRTFARDGRGDPMVLNPISTIITETLDLCRERLTKNNVKVETQIPEPAPQISCRPGEISQILLNLMHNAHDAMEGQKEERKIKIQVSESLHHVDISVEDSGPGIPDTLREKIMQPFFTTKPVGKGTGLGLSISMGIAQAHNGSLFLDATPKGTRFVLRLPRPVKAAQAA